MANKKDFFAEAVEEDDEPIIATPASTNSGLRRARIKGSWRMYWGQQIYNFEDGKHFNIPADLFDYLKKNGNIYDTL
jgi:hypothetical protein